MKSLIALPSDVGQTASRAPFGLRAVFLAIALAVVLAAQAPVFGLAARVMS